MGHAIYILNTAGSYMFKLLSLIWTTSELITRPAGEGNSKATNETTKSLVSPITIFIVVSQFKLEDGILSIFSGKQS